MFIEPRNMAGSDIVRTGGYREQVSAPLHLLNRFGKKPIGSGSSSISAGPSRLIWASRLKYDGASGKSVVIILTNASRDIG